MKPEIQQKIHNWEATHAHIESISDSLEMRDLIAVWNGIAQGWRRLEKLVWEETKSHLQTNDRWAWVIGRDQTPIRTYKAVVEKRNSAESKYLDLSLDPSVLDYAQPKEIARARDYWLIKAPSAEFTLADKKAKMAAIAEGEAVARTPMVPYIEKPAAAD